MERQSLTVIRLNREELVAVLALAETYIQVFGDRVKIDRPEYYRGIVGVQKKLNQLLVAEQSMIAA